MLTFILVLIIIAAVLLTIAILIQNPKGGGLSGEFGGSTSQMFGVQKTGDIMEKITWGLFTFIIIGALASSVFSSSIGGSDQENGLNVERSTAIPSTTPAPTTPGGLAPAPAATPAPQPAK